MHFRLVKAALIALVAAVVALTGIEASSHAHAPKLDGWHQSGDQGDTTHDDDLYGCAFCRLAHQTSFASVVPGTVSEPLLIASPRVQDVSSLAAAAPIRERSPRGPPRPASC